MDENALAGARRSLHAVAELVIAGPQHREHGTIRLCVSPGGFGGAVSALAVEGGELVWPSGRIAVDGRTCRELAEAAGVDVGAPDGLYHEGCGVAADEPLSLNSAAADLHASWFAIGGAALRAIAGVEPILWPEHFDLGVTVGEVNYGVSLGDGFHGEHYAYVGPWVARDGAFWNAPFGAFRSAAEIDGVPALTAYFDEGRREASGLDQVDDVGV